MTSPTEVSGVLLVDKPAGPTSFDVVKRVRHLLKVKRAGHTGTLDPNASGLLPVCVGDATRIATFIVEGTKTYEGVVRFGTTTDTLDSQGTVLETRDASHVTREAIEQALAAMVGVQAQIAPMYSARKVNGKRLYELAREGIEVEREAREITIEEARLEKWEAPEATIFVRCSKGTYIRTIAATLGEVLGCGAHLSALRRLSSGRLSIAQAVKLEDIEPRVKAGTLASEIISVEQALEDLPALQLNERRAIAVSFGNALENDAHAELGLKRLPTGTKARLLDPEGLVVAVGESDGQGTVKLLRVLRGRTGPGTYRRPPERE
jgi:tRNA pseudouridine55 synthase